MFTKLMRDGTKTLKIATKLPRVTLIVMNAAKKSTRMLTHIAKHATDTRKMVKNGNRIVMNIKIMLIPQEG